MILVTGGAGYIGSHIVLALRDAGRDVMVLDNLSTGFADAVPDGVRLVEADLRDTDRVIEALRGVEAVVHCAGSIVVNESIEKPLDYYGNNVSASVSLAKAMVAAGCQRLLFSSTAAVYGPVGDAPVSEDEPLKPANPYAASKAFVERILGDAAGQGLFDLGVLRYFNVAGADPAGRAGQRAPGATHLLKVAMAAGLGLRPAVEVTGTDYPTRDGTGVRDYIHVSDLAAAHVLLLDALAAEPGRPRLYNVGYGRGASVFEVLAVLGDALGQAVPWVAAARRPGDMASVVADNARILKELGWVPRHAALAEIVRDGLAWERRMLQG
ncbi:UDP-glucose 4-epimerase GalE [Sandaracinobacteroides saxicola]|uniref:UDP-glucose 4-epimerase n=1 Tax=Sandaracinobacteroides saxicola TaxID=2759707 RepID=A0A7G5IKL4_9SPHN|nr:UDP-glucose 4-epimerase GalE [Sandaracinobacteroides saxicola]QMW23906.1 UDP-glucose 4-epimerase GalE [Sandaracinobacteroides saxicola]